MLGGGGGDSGGGAGGRVLVVADSVVAELVTAYLRVVPEIIVGAL